MKVKRDTTIDIIKGIAIISVVLGHIWNQNCTSNIFYNQGRNFVYSYHILAFVFCSGYLYRNTKFLSMLKKRIKTLYIPTVICCLFSFLFYPLLYVLGTLDQLTIREILKKILKTVVFMPDGILVGALWFVPYLFVILLIFWSIYNIAKSKNHNTGIIIILSLICGIVGFIWILINPYGNNIIMRVIKHYYLPEALLSIPFFTLGYICKRKNYLSKINKHIWIVLMVLLITINYVCEISISIKDDEIGNGWFYLVTTIGLLFIISLSRELKTIRNINKGLVGIGKASFSIMAFHFICFKMIDGIIGNTLLIHDNNLKAFPVSFPNLWPVYLFVSVPVIVGVRFFINNVIIKKVKAND